MVAHQEEFAVGDRPAVPVRVGIGRLRDAVILEQVWLVEGDVVHVDLAVVADLDGVSADADDALDERRVVGLDPIGRRLEDDDVAALVRVDPGRQLVDKDVLSWLQGHLHRLLLDLVRLGDEGLDDEEDDEREDERLDDLEETPERGSSAHEMGRWLTSPAV